MVLKSLIAQCMRDHFWVAKIDDDEKFNYERMSIFRALFDKISASFRDGKIPDPDDEESTPRVNRARLAWMKELLEPLTRNHWYIYLEEKGQIVTDPEKIFRTLHEHVLSPYTVSYELKLVKDTELAVHLLNFMYVFDMESNEMNFGFQEQRQKHIDTKVNTGRYYDAVNRIFICAFEKCKDKHKICNLRVSEVFASFGKIFETASLSLPSITETDPQKQTFKKAAATLTAQLADECKNLHKDLELLDEEKEIFQLLIYVRLSLMHTKRPRK